MKYDDGCVYCEEEWTISVNDLNVAIISDKLLIEKLYAFSKLDTKIQISFCPFCGTKLKGENEWHTH